MTSVRRLILAATIALAPMIAAAQDDGFTTQFPLASCRFATVGGSPYFPLVPGRQAYLTNSACVATGRCTELNELWITTERDTRRISLPLSHGTRTVTARVMEERETEDGELVEISRNFLADCWPMHDVYYFGEEVDIYEDGQVVSHDGAWLAGKHGALPGVLMIDDGFLLGARYYQERAEGVAQDRSEHKRVGFSVQVPAGRFNDCVDVDETTPLEAGVSKKTYCRGVGLVKDGDLELTAVYRNSR